MPMFDSDEAFEAYVAQQQAELAGDDPSSSSAEEAAPKPNGLEQWQAVLGVVVPVALIAVVSVVLWRNAPDGRSQYTDPWDKILSTTAWMGGREYNANADTLTERLTFRKPLEEDNAPE